MLDILFYFICYTNYWHWNKNLAHFSFSLVATASLAHFSFSLVASTFVSGFWDLDVNFGIFQSFCEFGDVFFNLWIYFFNLGSFCKFGDLFWGSLDLAMNIKIKIEKLKKKNCDGHTDTHTCSFIYID